MFHYIPYDDIVEVRCWSVPMNKMFVFFPMPLLHTLVDKKRRVRLIILKN